MHEDNWCPGRSAELPIDATDKLIDAGAEVHVLFYVLPGRDCQLDENDLVALAWPQRSTYILDPLGMLRKEDLEGMQLLRDALDVVESVDSDYNLAILEALLQLL